MLVHFIWTFKMSHVFGGVWCIVYCMIKLITQTYNIE